MLALAFKNRKAELPEDPLDLYEADLDEGDPHANDSGGCAVSDAAVGGFLRAAGNKKGFGSSSADGADSSRAVAFFRERGMEDTFALEGGLPAWIAAGGELTS